MTAETPEPSQDHFITLLHEGVTFEHQSIYLSGHSYENCVFRRCTLVVKDFSAIGVVRNCQFEACVWYLNVMVHDAAAWRMFLEHLAPVISQVLPAGPADGTAPA